MMEINLPENYVLFIQVLSLQTPDTAGGRGDECLIRLDIRQTRCHDVLGELRLLRPVHPPSSKGRKVLICMSPLIVVSVVGRCSWPLQLVVKCAANALHDEHHVYHTEVISYIHELYTRADASDLLFLSNLIYRDGRCKSNLA